jgi:hypothetical protein
MEDELKQANINLFFDSKKAGRPAYANFCKVNPELGSDASFLLLDFTFFDSIAWSEKNKQNGSNLSDPFEMEGVARLVLPLEAAKRLMNDLQVVIATSETIRVESAANRIKSESGGRNG